MYLHNGQLYVGTEGGGINLLKGNDLHADVLEFEHLTKADGLHTDIIFDIMPWSENELLIQGNSALSIINHKFEIINFGKSFFQTPENRPFILGETWPIDLGDGRILLAPLDGLLVLNKSELRPETEPIRIALSAIYLEGKPNYAVDKLNRITLAPNERSMGVQFAALDYRGNDEILYQTHFYKEGNEEHPWDAPSKLSQFLVQDLTPGNYIFEVRSTNALGQWQDNTHRLQITVTPTFWESTAGWILQIGLLLLITVAITVQTVRVRMHRQQRAQTLEAYLELQERYLLVSNQPATGEQQQAEPLPIPEILVPGYSSMNDRFLNTLHQFMEQHISDNNLSIDEIADVTNMSRSSLNRKMHELFNLSAKDFVQAARIKHACNLLRTTDMAAKEVAYACGFSDPRYFSKSFKANTGKTPTEFRENP
ncbi:MAG: helix-turn-helix domain-containing protein [Paludibacteraceae bacterium]|nr:helix-turn-helix domain-containing protein [Paludibacteraceae bacterium]